MLPLSLPSVHVGLQTLRANPVRTLLSTLGVVMGAASLVAVLSVGDGAEAFARQQLERLGLQVVAVLAKTADTVDGLSIPRSTYPVFSIDQSKALSTRVMAGAAVALTTAGTGTFTIGEQGPPRAATLTGALGSPDALLTGMPVLHGRFLTDAEMNGDAAVAVVSNKLARELAGGRSLANVLNSALRLQGRRWTIVGVLDQYPNERTLGVMAPLLSAPSGMLPMQPPGAPRPRAILVRAPRMEDVQAVQAQVEAWADATDPRWRKNSLVTIAATGPERLRQLNQGMLVFKMIMGSFAAISLVVGGIGIMNVLLAAVAERTREIGVRKAAGAKRRDIAVQFLSESVAISLAGTIVGTVVGATSAFGVTALLRWRTQGLLYATLTWQTFLFSMSVAAAVGLILGVYPALKAARLSPVEVMRYQ